MIILVYRDYETIWNMIILVYRDMKLFGINFEMSNAYNIYINVETGIIIPVY